MIEPGPTRFHTPSLNVSTSAFTDDDQLFVHVPVRLVRRDAGLERRDVHLELVQRRRRLTHDAAY